MDGKTECKKLRLEAVAVLQSEKEGPIWAGKEIKLGDDIIKLHYLYLKKVNEEYSSKRTWTIHNTSLSLRNQAIR